MTGGLTMHKRVISKLAVTVTVGAHLLMPVAAADATDPNRSASVVAAIGSLGEHDVEATSQTEAASRSSRPDLTVTAGRVSLVDADYWAVRHKRVPVIWTDRTKSAGPGPAARSSSGLQFIVGPGRVIQPVAARRPVPGLAPGRSHAGEGRLRLDMPDWKFGTYPTRVCADSGGAVAETTEANNCRRLHEIHVVPYELRGRVTGLAQFAGVFPGVTLRWESEVAFSLKGLGVDRLRSQPFGDNGVFDYYWLTTGDFVRYTVTGTNTFDGCSWNGRGAYHPSYIHDNIRVSFGRPRGFLSAQLRVRPEFHFTVKITCPQGVSRTEDFYPYEWGGGSEWFVTGPEVQRFPDPGLTRLRGGYALQGPFPATYHWDLVARS